MWKIVTDSSGIIPEYAAAYKDIAYERVPFIIEVDGVGYIDDDTLDQRKLVDAIGSAKEAGKTACPSPEAWLGAVGDSDKIIVLTISANLSGSYNSAITAKEMLLEKHPERRVHIINSKGAGPTQTITLLRASHLISQGLSFDEVVKKLDAMVARTQTVFALCSFKNLIKNGRVSKVAGLVATTLKLWGVGIATPEGTIAIKGKVRGVKNMISSVIEYLREGGYTGGDIMITHCFNEEVATELKNAIKAIFKDAKVYITHTGGLCSFYAENQGLIISC